MQDLFLPSLGSYLKQTAIPLTSREDKTSDWAGTDVVALYFGLRW